MAHLPIMAFDRGVRPLSPSTVAVRAEAMNSNSDALIARRPPGNGGAEPPDSLMATAPSAMPGYSGRCNCSPRSWADSAKTNCGCALDLHDDPTVLAVTINQLPDTVPSLHCRCFDSSKQSIPCQ